MFGLSTLTGCMYSPVGKAFGGILNASILITDQYTKKSFRYKKDRMNSGWVRYWIVLHMNRNCGRNTTRRCDQSAGTHSAMRDAH